MNDQLHRYGGPTHDSGPRPTKPYSLRLSADERAKIERVAMKKKTPAAVLIRHAMQQAGLI